MVGTITEPHVQLGAGTIFAVKQIARFANGWLFDSDLQRHRENSNELDRTRDCGKPRQSRAP